MTPLASRCRRRNLAYARRHRARPRRSGGPSQGVGAAVGRELPEAERRPLCDDVLALEQTERRHKVRKRKPAEDADEQPVPTLTSESLLETFLSACTHPERCQFPHSRWADAMTSYPIISQRVLAAADRGGLLGLGARRRPTSELPLPNPHEAVVYKSGGDYVVDDGRPARMMTTWSMPRASA